MKENNDDIILVKDLVKKFGNFTANDNLSFSVKQGEIFGFLGANGAGKTTAIRILCGLLYPTSGYIRVAGYDVYTERDKIKRSIGYMSQKFSLYEDLTVVENIRFYAGIYGIRRKQISERTEELLVKLRLSEIRNRLIKDIPAGWRQKLAFSIAVFHNPKIVFLDEPTGGVDPITRRQFWELIHESSESGITVFVTTHYMDEAEYCDRVCIMADGRIEAMGAPGDLRKDYNVPDMNTLFIKIARK
jgi:ABC-2 type transport system ATP-binding protein